MRKRPAAQPTVFDGADTSRARTIIEAATGGPEACLGAAEGYALLECYGIPVADYGVAGGVDEGLELGVRHLVDLDEEGRDEDAGGGRPLLRVLGAPAHDEAAAGDINEAPKLGFLQSTGALRSLTGVGIKPSSCRAQYDERGGDASANESL